MVLVSDFPLEQRVVASYNAFDDTLMIEQVIRFYLL